MKSDLLWKLALGIAAGAGGYYVWRQASIASAPSAQVTNLTNAIQTASYNITNPTNMSDPYVQQYVSLWNQLNALPGGTTFPSIAQLQANYNATSPTPAVTGG
jgi:hypothetical protein